MEEKICDVLMVDNHNAFDCTGLIKCIKEWKSFIDPETEFNHVGDLSFGKNTSYGVFEYWKPQFLYILSNDEIINGDWFFQNIHKDTDNECLYVSKMLDNNYSVKEDIFLSQDLDGTESTCGRHYERKIIATNNPDLIKNGVPSIPMMFITSLIKENNNGNLIKKVVVQYEEDGITPMLSVNNSVTLYKA